MKNLELCVLHFSSLTKLAQKIKNIRKEKQSNQRWVKADLIVDDGGDATLLIHEGVKAEELFEKNGTLPDPASTDNAEFQIVLTIIRDGLKTDPKSTTR